MSSFRQITFPGLCVRCCVVVVTPSVDFIRQTDERDESFTGDFSEKFLKRATDVCDVLERSRIKHGNRKLRAGALFVQANTV